jgi:hypothetical protein
VNCATIQPLSPRRGGFFVVWRTLLKFDFRVRIDLTAENIAKIIHAITIEHAMMAALLIVGACVKAMIS